jgi:branched-subunit amino acid aminotransferase/4-amino-4-deoxychorismate lyase
MHYYLADRDAARIDPRSRALLLSGQGYVTETATANVLLYDEVEGLVSPPLDSILPGISLAVVRELASQLDVSFSQRLLTPHDLSVADEVLLASTPYCLLPVTRFNGRPIGSGEPGPIFRSLLDAWSQMQGVDIAAQAARFAKR